MEQSIDQNDIINEIINRVDDIITIAMETDQPLIEVALNAYQQIRPIMYGGFCVERESEIPKSAVIELQMLFDDGGVFN